MQIEGSFHRFVKQCTLFHDAICAGLNFPVSMISTLGHSPRQEWSCFESKAP